MLRHTALLALGTALLIAAVTRAQCTLHSSPGGSGCGTSTPFGIPTITCVGSPQLGNAAFGVTANVPCVMTVSALLLGPCRAQPFVIRSPFGVGGFCGPAEALCALFVDAATSIVVPGTPRTGGAAFAVPVPNDPRIVGALFCAQEFNLCTMPGGACIGASNAIAIRPI